MTSSWIKLLATGLGLGYLPLAPGTWGSLLGIALVIGLSFLPAKLAFLTLLTFTALSIWISGQAEKIFHEEDSSKIVIDEVCGMAWTLLFFPIKLQTVFIGFILFRALDVTKPPPIRKLENLSGGYGVVLDDVFAGIYSAIVLYVLLGLKIL